MGVIAIAAGATLEHWCQLPLFIFAGGSAGAYRIIWRHAEGEDVCVLLRR